MPASFSSSLRADYGGALNRCVAIFGRADQHSAGAEGAPYLSLKYIKFWGVFYCSSVERMRMCLPTCPILTMSRRLAILFDLAATAQDVLAPAQVSAAARPAAALPQAPPLADRIQAQAAIRSRLLSSTAAGGPKRPTVE
eukprot:scaffold3872_cov123-Isochrysis_galbana.AAC.2